MFQFGIEYLSLEEINQLQNIVLNQEDNLICYMEL